MTPPPMLLLSRLENSCLLERFMSRFHDQVRGFDELGGTDDFHEDTLAFVLR